MSSNEYIQDALISHQIYTQRYSAGEAKKVESLLDKVFKIVVAKLKEDKTPLTVERLVSVRSDILKILDELEFGVEINRSVDEFAKYESQYIAGLLTEATSASITTLAPEYVAALATSTPLSLTSTAGKTTTANIQQLISRFDSKVRSTVLNIINNGALEGLPVNEIALQVKATTSKRTLRQSKALTRTILNHVGVQARKSVFDANTDVIDKERFVATLDSRTTFICASNDGKTYPVRTGPKPPLHWNCRSIRVPVVHSKFGLDGLAGDRGFVSGDERGTVSAKTTFAGWLRKQPKAFQVDYLGVERAKLFRSGKYTLENFVDDSGRTIPLAKLAKKDAETLFNLRG